MHQYIPVYIVCTCAPQDFSFLYHMLIPMQLQETISYTTYDTTSYTTYDTTSYTTYDTTSYTTKLHHL